MNILKKLIKHFSSTPQISETNKPPVFSSVIQSQQPAKPINVENHNVTGTAYYKENIIHLGTLNPQYSMTKKQLISAKLYDTCINQYTFNPSQIELIPEPTNPYDPNAVKVVIDDQHVGHIKKGSCSHILKLIKDDKIQKITGTIKGGKSKILYCHSDCLDDFSLENFNENFSIKITIHIKE